MDAILGWMEWGWNGDGMGMEWGWNDIENEKRRNGWITPNMALRSGSLNRKGMLDTWSRLGISLGDADPPLPPAAPLDPTTTPAPALAMPTSVTSGPADPAPPPAPLTPVAPLTLDPAPPLDVLVAAATACAAATLGSPTSDASVPLNCGSDNPNAAFNSACNESTRNQLAIPSGPSVPPSHSMMDARRMPGHAEGIRNSGIGPPSTHSIKSKSNPNQIQIKSHRWLWK